MADWKQCCWCLQHALSVACVESITTFTTQLFCIVLLSLSLCNVYVIILSLIKSDRISRKAGDDSLLFLRHLAFIFRLSQSVSF